MAIIYPDGIDFDLLRGIGPLGLAVSGGSDSTAMAVLLTEAGIPDLEILHVDHGLRPHSSADADDVEYLADILGLSFMRLFAEGTPQGSLQAWARGERYRLLAEAARDLGLCAVVTAHTLDDQAETVLMRLARGSGVRGLSAIRPDSTLNGLRLLRPFLGARRADLRHALSERNITWREDPSNDDPRFDRTSIRNAQPLLEILGITPERLATTAQHLRRASDAIDDAANALWAQTVREDRVGCITIAREPWLCAPEEVRLRTLARAFARAGGAPHTPRFRSISKAAAIAEAGEGRTTLSHAVITASPAAIELWREFRDIAPVSLSPGQTAIFDNRYEIALDEDAPEMLVAPLGAWAKLCPSIGQLEARRTVPGLFLGGKLLAAPSLGVRTKGVAANIALVRRLG
ncbi:MAG: tRNA lysidine(34) synthetase TilS [Pseudomonadota bacterium]